MQVKNYLIVIGLVTAPLFSACTSEERTQELVQQKLDAEHLKDLQVQNQDLKTANEQLKIDNDKLKAEVARLQGRVAAAGTRSQTAVRPSGAAGARLANGDLPSPADVENLKHAVTGGNSFK